MQERNHLEDLFVEIKREVEEGGGKDSIYWIRRLINNYGKEKTEDNKNKV